MSIHDYFPFSVYVIFSHLCPFLSLGTSNLLVARKPVSVVALPVCGFILVDIYFCPVCCDGDNCSSLFLNVVWDPFHCFVTFVAD